MSCFSELGMYYLQSRYYDPVVRRFINADSMDLLENYLARDSILYINEDCVTRKSGGTDMEFEEKIAFLNGLEEKAVISEDDLSYLYELSHDLEPLIREMTASLLVMCSNEKAKKLLLTLSKDDNADVRTEAYDSLSVFPCDDVFLFLTEAINEEKDDLARCYATLSWAEVSKALQKDNEYWISWMTDKRSNSHSEQYMLCSSYALYLLGQKNELYDILNFLNSSEYHTRCMTISLLEEIVSVSNKYAIREALVQLLSSEKNRVVYSYADKLIKSISSSH